MEVTHALELLGVSSNDDAATVRAAYARRLFELHPDRSDAPDAHDATLELNAAYRIVLEDHRFRTTEQTAPPPPPPPPPSSSPPPPPPRAERPSAPSGVVSGTTRAAVPVAMLADDTIGIGLPGYEAYTIVVDTLHRLGEVTHDERGAGLLQVLVEFVDGPICQLLVTLQGRATGVTEVFCTIASIDDRPAPPIEAVTRLLLREMTALS